MASSSRGNCYRVSDGRTPLLLEAGIPFSEIRRGLDFQTSVLAGCLVSHEHGDHAKAVQDVLKAGIDLYTSHGTAEALGLTGHRLHEIRAKEAFRIGSWRVLPFPTIHDATEPLGFLLASGEERLLFATDTAYLENRFAGLTHIMLEVDYDLAILKRNVESGLVDREVKRRVLKSHMSLEHAKQFLKANDLSRIRTVWLLHLSEENSDAAQFKRAIQAIVGCLVRVA